MKLEKKTVTTIIILTTAALLGLICIQIYLLANALELKKQAFRARIYKLDSNLFVLLLSIALHLGAGSSNQLSRISPIAMGIMPLLVTWQSFIVR